MRTTSFRLPGFLWDWLQTFALYWFVFCLFEYVRRGHYDWRAELVIALVLSPIAPAVRALKRRRRGESVTKPTPPAA